MFRMHEGWDYTAYKFYVFGGVAALIGGPILLALILKDSFPTEIFTSTYMVALTAWIGGILAYWWWVFLFKDARDLQREAAAATGAVPLLAALKNLTTLHKAMAFNGGDMEAFMDANRRARRPILEFYGWQNLLVIWILGLVWAGMLDLIPNSLTWLLPVGVVAIAVLLMLRLNGLVGQSAEGFAQAYIAPLGLALVESPSIRIRPFALLGGGQVALPEGAAVLEGERRGRRIRIETQDDHSRTTIYSQIPDFALHSPDGKITGVRSVPGAVEKAVKKLRKARRWQGIRVTGGEEGITIERDTGKQNMWLYDLWLGEYLFEMAIGDTT